MEEYKIDLIRKDIVKNYAGEITYDDLVSEIKKRIVAPIFIEEEITKELDGIFTENLFLRNRVLLDILEIKDVIRNTFQEHSVTDIHLKFLNPVFWDIDKRLDKWHNHKIKELMKYCEELLSKRLT